MPGVTIASSYKDNCLNGVDSPDTKDTSGVPNILLTVTKLPTSNAVLLALIVSKFLDLFKSIIVGEIFSISKPLT